MKMTSQLGKTISATFLVAGTCIGGGMLALPVATGEAGFFPSLIMMLLGWAFMTITALYLSEVNLWMEKDVHVITMASRMLGPVGKAIAWVLYLFIGYASLVAYTAGGGQMMAFAVKNWFGFSLTPFLSLAIFVFIFGLIIYLGNQVVGKVNTLLVVGLVASYVFLVGSGLPFIEWKNLLHQSWGKTIVSIPLLLTIFSFQTIVPSLTIYLNQDGKALRWSIVLGTSLALIVYVLWQMLVLGTVLIDGQFGLAAALAQGKPINEFLSISLKNPWIGSLADFFAFFALVTSFLGIALGLFDFLADGLKIKKEKWGNVILGLLVAIPTLYFAYSFEKVFLVALDSSGGIGDSILNGIIPALMLWVGRYVKKMHSECKIFGGKPLMAAVIFYGCFVLTIEILGKFGIVASLGGS